MPSKPLISIRLVGTKQYLNRIYQLEQKVRNRIARPAITKASTPLRKQTKANLPKHTGLAKKNVITKVKAYPKTVVGITGLRSDKYVTAKDFWGRPRTFRASKYAHMLENGARPHAIRIGRGRKTIWHHPGTKATKFLSRAYQATRTQCQNILEEEIRKGLRKHA